MSEPPPDRAAFPWERRSPPAGVTGPGWTPAPDQPAVEGGRWIRPLEPLLPLAGVKLGGYVPRLLAYVVDVAVITAWLIVWIIALPADVRPSTGNDGLFVAILLIAAVGVLGYYPFCWSRGGQTIGLRLFGLRIVRDPDAARIGWRSAILRLLGYPVNSFVLYLGWIWIFIDKRRRGWHDLLARTVVVDDRSLQEFRSRASGGSG